MIQIHCISAWSSKGEDVNDNFYANGESVGSESKVINKGASESTVADPEQSSISGSRGMLQKLRKNVVTPVDVEPKGSETTVTRVNVMGKRDGMQPCLHLPLFSYELDLYVQFNCII